MIVDKEHRRLADAGRHQRQTNGLRKGMGRRCQAEIIRSLKRQAHILGVIIIHHVSTEIVDDDKIYQAQIRIFRAVLGIMLHKSAQFDQLVQLGVGQQVQTQKYGRCELPHGAKVINLQDERFHIQIVIG